jgi:hypothetical protein
MIPSYRQYYHRKQVFRDDDNIFFTGLVGFTLRYLYKDLDKPAKVICDSIFRKSALLYRRHQNRNGRSTYNFWQTDQPEIFPHAGLLNLFNESKALPDDMDVTSVVLLASDAADSTVAEVHRLMQHYTVTQNKKAKSSLPPYKNIQAYSTWFGNRMPIDLDFAVITNVLYMINKYGLPYTKADSASIEFLCRVVANRHYKNKAAIVSPSYNRTPVLLYHLSRLMAQRNIPELEKWKPQLVNDALNSYKQSNNFLDKVILSSSLIRWGVQLPADTIYTRSGLTGLIEDNNFVFFVASITSMLPHPYNVLSGKTAVGKFYFYCPAYNNILVLENLVLRKRMGK